MTVKENSGQRVHLIVLQVPESLEQRVLAQSCYSVLCWVMRDIAALVASFLPVIDANGAYLEQRWGLRQCHREKRTNRPEFGQLGNQGRI